MYSVNLRTHWFASFMFKTVASLKAKGSKTILTNQASLLGECLDTPVQLDTRNTWGMGKVSLENS